MAGNVEGFKERMKKQKWKVGSEEDVKEHKANVGK